MTTTKIKNIGERGFLSKILPSLSRLSPNQFLVPPGDDAAVLKTGSRAVLTIDGLTEGTHFKSNWSARCEKLIKVSLGRALGWKLMGCSLSDLAAMGDTKNRWAMVYLGAPSQTSVPFLQDLYQGIKESSRKYHCTLVGGDTVRARELTLVSAVGAELVGKKALTRSGAKVGDLVCLAGTVGDAAIGLDILIGKKKMKSTTDAAYFVKRFFRHQPLFKEGRILSREKGVTSLMDLSDSFQETIEIVCQASHVGAQVEISKVPVSKRYGLYFEKNQSPISAGEDYALLFTATEKAVQALKMKLSFSIVGHMIPSSKGIKFYNEGKSVKSQKIFSHFK